MYFYYWRHLLETLSIPENCFHWEFFPKFEQNTSSPESNGLSSISTASLSLQLVLKTQLANTIRNLAAFNTRVFMLLPRHLNEALSQFQHL